MVVTPPAKVIWHDLECGLYRADLPLWRELAWEHHEGPIVDVGAGTGRVTLDLAATERELIALDLDAELLAELRARSVGLPIQTVRADARDFKLDRAGGIGLCLAPMQTVQLLGGAEGRLRFLRAARAHMRAGGLLACAIVTELEPFDCRAGESPGPSPETVRIGERVYSSHALRVELGSERITIERERRISSEQGSGAHGLEGEPLVEYDTIELDRLTARELEREGRSVGLRPEPARKIAPTEEHTGSTVVMLRA
jgi:SAM-dependent methyltransferase